MESAKKSGYSMRENSMESSGTDCSSPYCSMARAQRSLSIFEAHEDILNMSPRLSLQNSKNIRLQRRLHYQNSLRNPEISLERSSSSSMASTETTLQKPAAELIKEIATIELEVVNMERYLLSLYRTAFDQYLTSSPTATNANVSMSPSDRAQSLLPDPTVKMHQPDHTDDSNRTNSRTNLPQGLENKEVKRSINFKYIDDSPSRHMDSGSDSKDDPAPAKDPKIVEPKCVASHRSLADHLGALVSDHVPDTPCKLSEDIIRCIAAIYCKLSNQHAQQAVDLIASPTPSVSSSSTFSPRGHCDSWSPRCHYEAATSPRQFDEAKDKNNPYGAMIEVPKISIDGDRFGYASKMLNIFRSLIRRLETIDPRNMAYEEQLAFWINVHNSLVMHAFLAYGLHQNHMKSTFSILKAAYNVGGHSVNAHVIQSSILRCQLRRPAEGLCSLFTPAKKLMKGNDKHQYALSPPDPLVHFALCLGTHSDPALRVYRAKGIKQELKLAKEEFIRANVVIQKEAKIVLPKILHYYAKDASMEMKIVEMVHDCVPEAQQKLIKECQQRKSEKCVQWSPYKSSFRYIVHRDLAKQ